MTRLGFRHVTQDDVAVFEAMAEAPAPRGATWELRDIRRAVEAEARVRGGTAKRGDELLVLTAKAKAAQDPTFEARVRDFIESSAT